jgi:pimeloyl-ACP methyl ester carboxylesterase
MAATSVSTLPMNHPKRLTKLYAQAANVDTNAVYPDVETNNTFERYVKRMREDYQKMSKTPDEFDVFDAQIKQMWASEPKWSKDCLAKITTPTAIVTGDHDEVIKREHTEYIVSVIPGAELITLPNVSHFAMLQAPDEYTNSALEFMEAN